MTGKMDCFGLTHTGSSQPVNQDQFLIADLEKSMRIHSSSLSLDNETRVFGNSQAKLLMVADGIGNSATGDLASRLATDSITRYVLNEMPWLLENDDQSDADLRHALISAFDHCEERIVFDVLEHPERAGMGSTLTMAYLIWPQLYVVHAGHSRCYLYRNSELHQLTRDHSLAERLVTSGTLDAEEVPEIWQSLLVNSIGGDDDSDLKPDLQKTQIQMGDTLLLCTDGLTKHVPAILISQILSQDTMADETCVRLVNQAKDNGGSDNITVVVARFLDQGDQDVAMVRSLETDTGNTETANTEMPPADRNSKLDHKPMTGNRNG